MGLYCFLYDSARQQDNIRVWTTDKFICDGTGLGKRLLTAIKHDLINMGLIEVHHDRKSSSGVFGKRYIEVKYVWKPEAVDKLFYQEDSDTTRYKIARALLIENFQPYEEIEYAYDDLVEFEVEMNGRYELVHAESFYFNEDGQLIARVGFSGDEASFDYTVPTHRTGELIIDLANSYKFSFNGILKTLNSSEPP